MSAQSILPYRICHLMLSFPALLLIPAATSNAQTAHPSFEVATVKPAPPGTDPNTGGWSLPGTSRFSATHVSVSLLIQLAYNVVESQITHKPEWLDTNLYDIAAKPEEGVRLTRDELRPRLQELLHQRFHLVVHTESQLRGGYALIVPKGGPHLTPTKGDHFPGYRINVSSGHMQGANWSMPQLAKYLTPAAGFPVVDRTGIAGSYDIDFSYDPNTGADSIGPSLNEALKLATGLLLRPQKVPVETLVINSVDQVPTAN